MPSRYTDGTALPPDQIAGYRVYQGLTAGTLSRVAELEGSAAASFTVTGLGAGRHFFAVSAFTVTGVEGELSVAGFKDIVL
jgi:hypothetical protein